MRVFPISRRYVPRGNWNGGSRAKAAWGRGFLVWLACLWIPPIPFKEDKGYATPIGEGDVVKDGVRSALGAGNDGGFMYFPPIRAGGGPTKRGKVKLEQEVLNSTKCEPVSLGAWPKWGREEQNQTIEKLMGCSVSAATRAGYEGHFKQWALYRSVNGLGPYLGIPVRIRTMMRRVSWHM